MGLPEVSLEDLARLDARRSLWHSADPMILILGTLFWAIPRGSLVRGSGGVSEKLERPGSRGRGFSGLGELVIDRPFSNIRCLSDSPR